MRLSASMSVVVLVLVLSLAAVGVAYGFWANTLSVQGTVQTGDFNAKFTAASTNDPLVNAAGDPVVSPDPCTPGLNPTGCTAPAKDVGSCTARVIRHPYWAEPREVKVAVSNAYPGYECEVDVTLTKGGCVPECIKYVVIDSPPQLAVTELSHLTGTVLDHAGQEVEGSFLVSVNQSAHQDATYEFTVSITATLWLWCHQHP